MTEPPENKEKRILRLMSYTGERPRRLLVPNGRILDFVLIE